MRYPLNVLQTRLPPNDPLRLSLHNEVHARPPALVHLPTLVTLVAVLNDGVERETERLHLCGLPGQDHLTAADVAGNFIRMKIPAGYSIRWERHTEFTRYSIIQPLPNGMGLGAEQPDLAANLATHDGWLAQTPGKTVAAVQLVMVTANLSDSAAVLDVAKRWFGRRTLVASKMGPDYSWALTDFQVNADGFERMLVLVPEGTSEARAGRIAMRLLEIETYRLMALRGLPVAKELGPMLSLAENELADLTAKMEGKAASEESLLDSLIVLAARVERASSEHNYRFSATYAYDELVRQRIAELYEVANPGTQTLGEFMKRRMSPAIATVASTSRRLDSLAERISRTSALLRTRVDIATEEQNRVLLEKLTRGQELQFQLQSTVEGLSIAAISYYVVSLLLYVVKALKTAGLPIHPEMTVGALIPLVLYSVWKTTQRIHKKLHR